MAKTDHDWLKVTLHHPPLTAEAVSALLFEEGAEGIWEDNPDSKGRLVTRAGFSPWRQEDLSATLPLLVARLAEAFDLATADFEYYLELEENHDWAEKWKEGLKPIVIGPRLAVAPTWWPKEPWPEGQLVLRLDPGLAFGSGHHATTFLCLSLLTELAPQARRVLDVGAGSGILSLAAAGLNPRAEIIGVDNDLETISVALGNALANGLEDRVNFSGRALYELSPPFDLIMANITLTPLIELAPAITGLASGEGRLILSGLLATQVDEVSGYYAVNGWLLERRLNQDEWSALVFARPGAADVKWEEECEPSV